MWSGAQWVKYTTDLHESVTVAYLVLTCDQMGALPLLMPSAIQCVPNKKDTRFISGISSWTRMI